MNEVQTPHAEIDLVYNASRRLIAATTPLEQLEAVSEHARSQGASKGAIFYFEYDGEDRTDVVTAEWVEGDGIPYQVGTRFPLPRMSNRLTPPEASPLLIADTRTDERLSPSIREIDLRYGVHACVILLLYNRGQRVAAILFGWDKPRAFDERDQRIYTGLQQLAAPAVDSLRLFDQTQRRAAELEQANQEINLLYHTSEIINSASTYQEVVEAVAHFDPEADVVTLMLWENMDWATADFIELMVVIDRTGRSQLQPGTRLNKADYPIARTMLGERVWIIEDAHTDARVDPITARSWAMLDIRSFMGPAMYVDQRWAGGITFHSARPRIYTAREKRLLAGVGDLVTAAILRIRARQETEAARQRAEAFAQRAHQLAVLEERNRLARELHDSVSQALYGIVLGAQTARIFLDRDPRQAVEPLDYVLSLSEAGLAEMRALIFELRPETLEKEGLVEALSKQVTMLQARHGLQVRTTFDAEPDIAIHLKEAVYWIAREALHNIIKHANASTVEISIASQPDTLTLCITDDGSGFDINGDYAGHLGLKSMSERAVKVGGTLHMQSAAEAGTSITFCLPLETPC